MIWFVFGMKMFFRKKPISTKTSLFRHKVLSEYLQQVRQNSYLHSKSKTIVKNVFGPLNTCNLFGQLIVTGNKYSPVEHPQIMQQYLSKCLIRILNIN